MPALQVDDRVSRLQGRSLHNRVAWRAVHGRPCIVAVGAAHEWASSSPLPADVVVTDLVAASLEDPALARALWGPFLACLAWPLLPWRRMLPRALRPALQVRVGIASGPLRHAVSDAIAHSTGPLRCRVVPAPL